MRSPRRSPSLLRRLARGVALLLLALLVVFSLFLAIDSFGKPISTLMLAHVVRGESYSRSYVPLSAISPVALASVVASEDSQFCQNDGVDWRSLKEVLSNPNGPTRGASTITMQVAKNLFLWPQRSAVRKALEIPTALTLGRLWSKAHTLEVYLNIAEWGDNLFGIDAASRRYFGHAASKLSAREAALLATSLPNPIERDAADPEPFQRRLAATIMARVRSSSDLLDCLAGQ